MIADVRTNTDNWDEVVAHLNSARDEFVESVGEFIDRMVRRLELTTAKQK